MPRPYFNVLFKDALSLISQHPLPTLVTGLLCFCGAAIVGNVLYAAMIIDVYQRTSSFFSSHASIYYTQQQVQGVIGFLLMSIGRGAISWIALQTYRQADAANAEDSGREPEDEITLKNAVRAALRNWPVLILSALLYGTLMSLAVAGLVYVLREVRLDLSNYRWLRNEPNAITSAMIVRGINISMPDPGSPFTEIYNYTRFSLSRSTSSVYYGWMNYSQTVGRFSVQLALIGLVSALGILLIDTLLCFRNVAIMNQRRAHALSWIATCTQLSRRHFWSIASARVGLRAIMYLTSLLCLTLPMTIQQSMILPNVVQRVQSYLPYALNGAASNIALALASGIFVVFGLAFDVRLFLALQHPEPIATHPNPPSG